MGILYLRFVKELLKRRYERKEIRRLCRDIKPFFDYLRDDPCVKSVRGVRLHHVRDYADRVKSSCTATAAFMTVLDANDKLNAVKMFCLQMFIAGLLPRDYADFVGCVEFPKPGRNNG
jgi:hypothetical protein